MNISFWFLWAALAVTFWLGMTYGEWFERRKRRHLQRWKREAGK